MKGASLLTTGLALTLALALAGCGTKQEAAAPASWPTMAVRAQVVETKQRVATEEVVGTVRARLGSSCRSETQHLQAVSFSREWKAEHDWSSVH